jgi:hypothetical protein
MPFSCKTLQIPLQCEICRLKSAIISFHAVDPKSQAELTLVILLGLLDGHSTNQDQLEHRRNATRLTDVIETQQTMAEHNWIFRCVVCFNEPETNSLARSFHKPGYGALTLLLNMLSFLFERPAFISIVQHMLVRMFPSLFVLLHLFRRSA